VFRSGRRLAARRPAATQSTGKRAEPPEQAEHNPRWAQLALGIPRKAEVHATTAPLIARAPDDEPTDAGTPAPVAGTPSPDAGTPATEDAGTPARAAGTPTPDAGGTPTPTPAAPAPAAPPPAGATSAGGHFVPPAGVAACPDAPPRTIAVVGCISAPSSPPLAKETAVLPTPTPGRFGGDADRGKFAKELAQCRADRTVKEEIEKRFRTDVGEARKKATEESKAETEAALKTAVEGIDPKDKAAIFKARTKAAADAKKAATKKITEAGAAVTKQDVAKVSAELAKKFEDNLADDYDHTMTGGLARYGASWRGTMQARLDAARKKITKQKSAKPVVPKGATPPPAKKPEEIAAEVEAEMVSVRCEQENWALDQIEGIKHGWAVGRREEVDFITLGFGSAKYLKDFKPTYEIAEADRVPIPEALQSSKGMPGVAPEVAAFLTALAADPSTPKFLAGNYKGHGGQYFAGKGFSVDLLLTGAPLDVRGFYTVSTAVKFLTALDTTATAMGARWRVLYNDYTVAQQVNAATGFTNVGFWGDSNFPSLNWHGPLVLHMHLDLEIPKAPPPAPATPSPATPTP
jgi:hypothetical protein